LFRCSSSMLLGNLSNDSVASSLLKTINTNHNVHKKTQPNASTQQQQTKASSSSKESSLWDYSDVFGQEWQQGLGTAHQVLSKDNSNTPVKTSPQRVDKEQRSEQNKERIKATRAEKKKNNKSSCVASRHALNKPHSLPSKVGNSTERLSQKPSFREELESWRLRNSQPIPLDSKKTKPSLKTRDEDSLPWKTLKRSAIERDVDWSDEESDKEVYSFEDLMREEERSARIAAIEDAEEYRKEQERKRKKKLKRLGLV